MRIMDLSFLAVMMDSHVATTVHAQSSEQEKIPTVPASAKKDAYAFATALVEGQEGIIDAGEALATLPQVSQGMTNVPNQLAATRTAHAKWRLAASHSTRSPTGPD